MPVVSITTRSNLSAPWSRFSLSEPRMRIRSPRTVQQMQPLFISTICSSDFSMISLSTPLSPNSFSITAMRWPWSSLRMRLSSVVLPLPRKPVRIVTGTMLLSCMGAPSEGRIIGQSLDHPVDAGPHRFWDADAEGIRSFQVYYQFETGALVNRQLARIRAFEDSRSDLCRSPRFVQKVRSVRKQTAPADQVRFREDHWHALCHSQLHHFLRNVRTHDEAHRLVDKHRI